jgi:hypothetical protein
LAPPIKIEFYVSVYGFAIHAESKICSAEDPCQLPEY